MKFTTSWRMASLWVFLPLTLLASQMFLGSVFPADEAYPLADQVRAFGSIALIYPLICASAAIAGARIKRSDILNHPLRRRPRAFIGATLALAPGVVAFVVTVVTMGMYSFMMSASAFVAWPMIVCAIVSAAAYSLLGMALGLRLPALLAIPLAILIPYMLVAIPPALDVQWLRHLTSVNTSCCAIDQTLSGRAVSVFVLFHVALAAASVAFIARARAVSEPRRRALLGYGGAALVGAVAVGAAQPLPYAPVSERAGRPDCAVTAGFDVCLWPEHASSRAAVAPVLKKVRAIADETGVKVPTRLVERPQQTSAWPVVFVDLPPGNNTQLSASIAAALFPSDASCSSTDPNGDAVADPSGVLSAPLASRMWWKWRLHEDPQDPGTDQEATKIFQQLQRLDDRSQGQRVNKLAEDLQAFCQGKKS